MVVVSKVRVRKIYRITRLNQDWSSTYRDFLTEWDSQSGLPCVSSRRNEAKIYKSAPTVLQQLAIAIERTGLNDWTVETEEIPVV